MSDMDKMQADAVNRAREMYSRRSPPYSANGFPNGYNGKMKSPPTVPAERKYNTSNDIQNQMNKVTADKHPDETDNATTDGEEKAKYEEAAENHIPQNDFLESLLADKEKTLIILLIALLNEEKASSSLLLALMYLII